MIDVVPIVLIFELKHADFLGLQLPRNCIDAASSLYRCYITSVLMLYNDSVVIVAIQNRDYVCEDTWLVTASLYYLGLYRYCIAASRRVLRFSSNNKVDSKACAPTRMKTIGRESYGVFFWDSQKITILDYLGKFETITGAKYASLLKAKLHEKTPFISRRLTSLFNISIVLSFGISLFFSLDCNIRKNKINVYFL